MGQEDQIIQKMELKRGQILRKNNWLPRGRVRHLARQIHDLELYLSGLRKTKKHHRPSTIYLFDKTEILRIEEDKKTAQSIRIAGR